MSGRTRVFFRVLFVLVLGWAVFVRCWGVGQRSFWMDEAWVVNAVTNLSFKELLFQTELPIPPLFAVSVKLIGRWVSPPEVGLRLLPMVCGIACVPLAYLTARTLRLPRITSLAGMALCASGPLLVIWSRELKQYEMEAFFSVLLALLVFRTRRFPKGQNRLAVTIGILLICLFGPWFGYGFIFAAAVLMGILIFLPPISGSRRLMVITGLVGSAGLAISIVSVLYAAASEQAGQEALLTFTKPWFIDVTSLRSWARAGAYGASSTVTMIFPFRRWILYLCLTGILGAGVWLITLLGLWNWPRKARIEMTCWVVGPWLLMVAATIARKYPFGAPRMMVFLAVPMMLAIAMGLVAVCRSLCTSIAGRSDVGIILGLALSLLPVFYMLGVPLGYKYWVNQDFPAVLSVLEQRRKSGEMVFVTLEAVQAVQYYACDYGEDFTFAPCSAGTLPPPDYDYDGLFGGVLRRAEGQWWLITTNIRRDIGRQRLMRMARLQGYEFQLIAEANGNKVYGVAQLYSVRKGDGR